MIHKSIVLVAMAATLLIPQIMRAQVPNGDFEQWLLGQPVGWITPNLYAPGTITQSTDAHGGTSAAHGVVKDVTFGVFLQTGRIGTDLEPKEGFPYTQKPTIM